MIDIEFLSAAFNNLVTRAVEFIPKLLTALLILLLGWLVARIVAAVVKRILKRLDFDGIVDRTGIGEGLRKAEIKQTGTEIVGVLIYWIILLNFGLLALESLGFTAALEPVRALIGLLPRLLLALTTLIIGILIAQFLGRAVQAAMASMGVDLHEQIGNLVIIVVIIMVIIVVLEQLGIDASIMSGIFTNVLTIIVAGVALAFALGGRELARNVLAGYYAREQFQLGDRLVFEGDEGTLEGIGVLNAEIRVGNDVVVLPNARLMEEVIRKRE